MKVHGNGTAKILSTADIHHAITQPDIYKRTVFSVMLYTVCRVSEAIQLRKDDVVNNTIVFRRSTTKGKHTTRCVPTNPELASILADYLYVINKTRPDSVYLFPGQRGVRDYVSRDTVDDWFRTFCSNHAITGASTHSFRRTGATFMANAGVPVRTIQKLGGWSSLDALQRYLEVTDADKVAAVATMAFNPEVELWGGSAGRY